MTNIFIGKLLILSRNYLGCRLFSCLEMCLCRGANPSRKLSSQSPGLWHRSDRWCTGWKCIELIRVMKLVQLFITAHARRIPYRICRSKSCNAFGCCRPILAEYLFIRQISIIWVWIFMSEYCNFQQRN